MTKEYFVNEGGIIGSQNNTFNSSSEDFFKVREIIMKASKSQTPQQKLENNLFSLKLDLEDYLNDKNPEKVLLVGTFLKELMSIYKIKHRTFASYIGLSESNLSAIIAGRRKINNDLALKLGHIFKTEADIWINIQNKNDLLMIKREDNSKYTKYKLEDLVYPA